MELKIRGRSRRDGKIVPVQEIYPHRDTGFLVGFEGYDESYPEYNGVVDLELMTGFRDVRGKNIWEHDSVEFGDLIFSVVWDTDKGCWSLENDYGFFPLAPVVANVAVMEEKN
jgi:hypothetical protein